MQKQIEEELSAAGVDIGSELVKKLIPVIGNLIGKITGKKDLPDTATAINTGKAKKYILTVTVQELE